ncbi:MAG: hypothetical protein CVV10_02810 [Gammaproteobacteria bacterium HGW-Gammaproteobacteria-14]|nr:MAG: hypothetical protein CVV10_02810 [Gammaproteobacteria bacterium HGW-Gammaproteobacteria-14]
MLPKNLISLIAAALIATMALPAQAAVKRSLCVFDIVGTSGDVFNMMRDYRTAALAWGVDFDLKVYTDEMIATEDLKAGQCDAAAITGIRGRQLNQYTGSLDSVGALPSYQHVREAISVLASGHPAIEPKLSSGPFEVVGISPMGAAYLFVKDRTINTVNKLAGKSISVMEYDAAQAKMAARVGMSPVLSDITNFAGRFNNGNVDICFAPVMAYSALELYKGMQPNGGIVDYVLGQLTLQVITRKDRFPAGFGGESRKYMLGQFDQAMRIIENAEKEVDQKWWVRIPEADRARYDEMMRESRIALRDEGIYDPDMMRLLRGIRCRVDGSRSECVNPQE